MLSAPSDELQGRTVGQRAQQRAVAGALSALLGDGAVRNVEQVGLRLVGRARPDPPDVYQPTQSTPPDYVNINRLGTTA